MTAEIQISMLLAKRRGVCPFRPRLVNSMISKLKGCRGDENDFKIRDQELLEGWAIFR